MQPQSQMEWKERSLQMREFQEDERHRHNLETELLGQNRVGLAGQKQAEKDDDSMVLAKGVMKGTIPPTSQYLGTYTSRQKTEADIEKLGGNLSSAVMQWQAQNRAVMSMNGPQQVRFRQLANSVKPFLEEIEDLSTQLDQSGMA
jgi:hypothetical protein